MCTPLGEVFPRSSDEGLIYHWRQSLGAGALWGVICDKNVMFLFFFRSTKIGVCNKVNSEPAAFFAFFGVIPLVQEKILAHFGPPEPPPSTSCKDGALISAVLMIQLKLHMSSVF